MANSKPRTIVLISYNRVDGFSSGWHARRKVFVCANGEGRGASTGEGKDKYARAGSVMHNISGQYYNGAVPVERVKHYYIYAGLYAMEQAIGIAKSLRSKNGSPVTVVACSCDTGKKENLLADTGISIKWCECGGESTMGRIAEAAIKG